MKILITGSKGQLGNALQETLKGHDLHLIDLPEHDLTSFPTTMSRFLQVKPEIVIHCAAKTQVDDCELKPEEAYWANVMATKHVVNACHAVDAALVYVSTDYVFDGNGTKPYLEYEPCNPASVYGKTKWLGEEIVKTHLQRFYIVRTAWLFGDVGQNIVKTVLKLAQTQKLLKFVNDQTGCPTYAADLAAAIAGLIQTNAFGIYHITNEGHCTWFEFVREILAAAEIKETKVEPISSSELSRPAPRPHYSVLAKDGLHSVGITMPVYQDALGRFLKKYNA